MEKGFFDRLSAPWLKLLLGLGDHVQFPQVFSYFWGLGGAASTDNPQNRKKKLISPHSLTLGVWIFGFRVRVWGMGFRF